MIFLNTRFMQVETTEKRERERERERKKRAFRTYVFKYNVLVFELYNSYD